ncbi:MAG: UDP-glucose dehydrogenase family protein [Bacteroidota bacterium]
MKICVIGTGYVGLVTGVCLADLGNEVICVDRDAEKIGGLWQGKLPIYEPGLEELVSKNVSEGRLTFSTDLIESVRPATVVFITVGTPPKPNGEPDLSGVEAVARSIGQGLDGYKVIINKSTVPIGSGDWVAMLVREGMGLEVPVHVHGHGQLQTGDASFDVVSNPEFLREGTAIMDTFFPDRIVVGSNSERALAVMQELYRPLVERTFLPEGERQRVPFIVTDLNSAEMIKYAANAFLATKISFINEIANICERVGADIGKVAEGIGLDHRIGRSFLDAGLGWGGSCFPKDISALISIATDYGYRGELLEAVKHVNERQRQLLLSKLQSHLKVLKGKTVCLLGLAFKPETDDIRDAPAIYLAEQILKLGGRVKGYDPVAAENSKKAVPQLCLCPSAKEAIQDSDAVVICTEWEEFRLLDWKELKSLVRNPLLIDGRNCFDSQVTEAGWTYVGVGR